MHSHGWVFVLNKTQSIEIIVKLGQLPVKQFDLRLRDIIEVAI